MSDTVSNDVSTESLCTVIENLNAPPANGHHHHHHHHQITTQNNNNNNNNDNDNDNEDNKSIFQTTNIQGKIHKRHENIPRDQQQQSNRRRNETASSDLSDSSGNGHDEDIGIDSDSRNGQGQDSSFEDGGISLRECDWTTEDDGATTTEAESNRETTPEKCLRRIGKVHTDQDIDEGLQKNKLSSTTTATATATTTAIPIASATSLRTTTTTTPGGKAKKSVSFDPNDEKVRKFITGEPIVDQQNPFKLNGFISNSNTTSNSNSSSIVRNNKKKTPPPVPTRRSTLSIKKTVTQQLREREREREKEKERERFKNEANNRRTQSAATQSAAAATNTIVSNNPTSVPSINSSTSPTSPTEEFITTEDVLKQSKYVKTYIKNPDPFFVYDPAILARLKFEALREIRPPKKLKPFSLQQSRDHYQAGRQRDNRNKDLGKDLRKIPTFKKCSKPNYPELSDIKVKVGTDLDEIFFNPAEVTKNAKKFDERVKKLHLSSEDDLDEVDGPLTKSESSDEVPAVQNGNKSPIESIDEVLTISEDTTDFISDPSMMMNGGDNSAISSTDPIKSPAHGGTFTNTIRSREFQDYLDKKGLTLIPKKIPSGAQAIYTNGGPRHNAHMSFRSPERVKISFDNNNSNTISNTTSGSNMDGTPSKKPSVFQRLLSNSIFASRRKTTPKDIVPTPRSIYATSANQSGPKAKNKDNTENATLIKRVVLERQSFHGRPRAHNNLLSSSAGDTLDRSNPTELARSRKSFAGGDDLSISISSALTNAEYAIHPPSKTQMMMANETVASSQSWPITISGEPSSSSRIKPPRRTLSRDRLRSNEVANENNMKISSMALPQKMPQNALSLPRGLEHDSIHFQRTTERQSLIPKRSSQPNDRRTVFGRSASMDRNEILKRSAASRHTQQQNENRITTDESVDRLPSNVIQPKSHDSLRDQFNAAIKGSTMMSSTPIRLETRAPSEELQVDSQEWQRLRAMKDRTDRELYHRMLQQQQQQQQLESENIYEHLKPKQSQGTQAVLATDGNFMRGSPQRNTFSGITRNRQVKIIDGRAVLAAVPSSESGRQQMAPPSKQQQQQQQHSVEIHNEQHLAPRSQSVLDGMTQPQNSLSRLRRGYESDNETPVIFRRKGIMGTATDSEQQPRRIGGILTREEILAKVKEFCRKSLNKTPTAQAQIHAQPATVSLDISPVSYASVETHHRPISRLYTIPQVPQRMQSLPEQPTAQQFIPVLPAQQISAAANASPIYAHVVKRSSLQSNQSELYDSPPAQGQRSYLLRRESDATRQQVYIRNGATLQPAELIIPHTTPQYVIVDGDKVSPAQVIDIYPAQSQYVRPHQLQPIMAGGTYGTYILPHKQHQHQQQQQQQQQQILYPQGTLRTTAAAVRLSEGGRTTPLILDRSSNHQASQIYWTPHQQQRRLYFQQQQQQHMKQQHAGLLPVEISPRYTLKQSIVYPVPAPRHATIANVQHSLNNRAMVQVTQQNGALPAFQKQQLILAQHGTTTPPPPTQQLSSLQPIKQQPQLQQHIQTVYAPNGEWESGSEAGEVQRIMENRRYSNGGEFKGSNVLKTLKLRFSKLVGGSSSGSNLNILKR